MLVYHGTNADINEINLTLGSRFKDFGQGFYVTPDIETAMRMARKKADLFQGVPTLITYEFNEAALTAAGLSVLEFPPQATSEWLMFISSNRERRNPQPHHRYDIVKGPIADDGVALQLSRLRANVSNADQIALDLQDKYLDQQICFNTPRSLPYLHKVSSCQIR